MIYGSNLIQVRKEVEHSLNFPMSDTRWLWDEAELRAMTTGVAALRSRTLFPPNLSWIRASRGSRFELRHFTWLHIQDGRKAHQVSNSSPFQFNAWISPTCPRDPCYFLKTHLAVQCNENIRNPILDGLFICLPLVAFPSHIGLWTQLEIEFSLTRQDGISYTLVTGPGKKIFFKIVCSCTWHRGESRNPGKPFCCTLHYVVQEMSSVLPQSTFLTS